MAKFANKVVVKNEGQTSISYLLAERANDIQTFKIARHEVASYDAAKFTFYAKVTFKDGVTIHVKFSHKSFFGMKVKPTVDAQVESMSSFLRGRDMEFLTEEEASKLQNAAATEFTVLGAVDRRKDGKLQYKLEDYVNYSEVISKHSLDDPNFPWNRLYSGGPKLTAKPLQDIVVSGYGSPFWASEE
jgi:hypothetical protein